MSCTCPPLKTRKTRSMHRKGCPHFVPATPLHLPRSGKPATTWGTKRLLIWYRDEGACQLCGVRIRAGEEWTLDHVVPRSKGGSDRWGNLQVAHRGCNQDRGHKSLATWFYGEEAAGFAPLYSPS